jgi:hypothetical protein
MAAALVVVLLAATANAAGSAAAAAAAAAVVRLDTANLLRKWDGIGGLSAGASSRLLFDYPEAARSDVLDLLFTPRLGWGYQILKMELGWVCASVRAGRDVPRRLRAHES